MKVVNISSSSIASSVDDAIHRLLGIVRTVKLNSFEQAIILQLLEELNE